MTKKYMRGTLTALSAVAGLALAGCADENPYPTYNNGVAYYQAPPSGTTYYATPPSPCANCNNSGAGWYRYHDGQWHVD